MSTATFVEQLFTKFLGRSADLAGRDFWANQIDNGSLNAAQVTQNFLDSAEYGGQVLPIARLYYAAFGRIPDAGGLSYWLTTARAGATLAQISANFVRSAEFATLYGTTVTDTKFIDLLYQNVLGRAPDAGGKAYWLARMTTDKQTRAAVLNSFSDSAELINSKNSEIKVVVEYQNILGSTPTRAQIDAALKLETSALITQLYSDDSYTGVPAPYLNTKGMVVDGYLKNASVFVDTNQNGVQDNNEYGTLSNVQGNFTFLGHESFNGVLVAQQGRDISTGQFQEGQYLAPAGSTVITPLTTVLQKLIQSASLSRTEVLSLLSNRLQLDASIDVTRIDPIGASVKAGASPEAQAAALKIHITNAQINTLVTQSAAFLKGLGLATDGGSGENAAFQALANALLNPRLPTNVDLTSIELIRLVLADSAHLLQANDSQQMQVDALGGQITDVISALNTALGAVSESTPLASLTKIAQIQYAARDFLSLIQDGVVLNDLSLVNEHIAPEQFDLAVGAALGRLGPIVQDITAPTLVSSVPADDASPVLASANIVLTFSEAVHAGSGNFIISNGKDIRTIAASDASQVSIFNRTVTINPRSDLINGTAYQVLIDKTAITDLVDNSYVGISDASKLNFTVPANTLALAGLSGSTGSNPGSRFIATAASGMAVAAAGDVNNDGFADFLVGASATNNTGTSFLVYGKASGFTATTQLSSAAQFVGNMAGEFAGCALGTAGDFNGDGIADIVIGANGAAPSSVSLAGSTYVVFGKPAVFSGSTKLASLDGKTGFRFDGDSANAWVGSSVATAGDVNGDGLSDLIIGANGSNGTTGAAYVVFGKTGVQPATLKASALTGMNGFRLSGSSANDNTGFSVSSAGDVNGDGFDDVLVGAFGANHDAGAAYLVFGKAGGFDANLDLSTLDGMNGVRFDGAAGDNAGRSVSRVGDFNGDGFSDFLIGAFHANGDTGSAYLVYGKADGFTASVDLSMLDGMNGVRFDGAASKDLTGLAVSAAGDVNGDGLADLIIGAREANSRFGAGYIVYGTGATLPAKISLADLNGINGYRLNGAPVDLAGGSVAGVGDVNGDGLSDVLIGAQGIGSAVGSSYLVFGNNASNVIHTFGTSANNTITGTAGDDSISALAGDDTIIGGGGADIVLGGVGKDRIVVSDLTFRLIDGGGGSDTLALSGADMPLNLSAALPFLRSIETIDLTGTGNNSVMLTAASVLKISESTNKLTILGNTGDVVQIGPGWIDDRIVMGMHQYHLGQAIVAVGMALTVDMT